MWNPLFFYITVVFVVISMSDSLAIYPSISLSCESPHTACCVSSLRGHQLPHLFSVFLCPLPSAFRLSQYAASSYCFSLECSYVFLFPSLLKSRSFLSTSTSISLLTTCLPRFLFLVFICPILPLFLSLYICLTALLSLQKSATTNWHSNSLHARRMINDDYAAVINPLNGSSSPSCFFLNALSFFPSFRDICKITPVTTKRDLTSFCADVQGIMNVIFKGEVRFHSPVTKTRKKTEGS